MNAQQMKNECRAAFARHETFHPRFGWLQKAYDRANQNPAAFLAQDATVSFGVGKNMVLAIRFWGLAFKLLREEPDPSRPRVSLLLPTEFGTSMLGEGGWDPYLERAESLWLLHWQLLRGTCAIPVWWVAFNVMSRQAFTEAQLQEQVIELASACGWPAVVPASVKKDVDCMIRTYTIRGHGKQKLDDILDCPFRELGLLEQAPGKQGGWRVAYGSKATLTPLVVLHASLDFMARHSGGDRSMSIARLAADPGSPGRVFGLYESDLYEYLVAAVAGRSNIQIAVTAGLRQLVSDDGDFGGMADRVAAQMYDGRLRKVLA